MAELIVEDKPIELSRFSDLTVNCSDYAEFKCYVSDPTAEGKWYKANTSESVTPGDENLPGRKTGWSGHSRPAGIEKKIQRAEAPCLQSYKNAKSD